jgi:hypothetical protein
VAPSDANFGDKGDLFLLVPLFDLQFLARVSGNRGRDFAAAALASCYPIDVLLFVEQQIERAGIGGQITPEQAARLNTHSPGPFQPHVLQPSRCTGPASRQEVEHSARSLDDADIGQARREFLDEGLFAGNTQRDPQAVRPQFVDFFDLGPQRLAPQIAMRASDDP